jgi:HD-GYP domain-containing protein (c-di-GMP phosphodiesterase class II)
MRDGRGSLELVHKLTEVGVALSSEKDEGTLLELILQGAREITGADGGTLYTRTDADTLEFAIMFTETLGIHLGGTSGKEVKLPPIAMFDEDGTPNDHMVAANAAVSGRIVNVADAYDTGEFDFSGTREFDVRTGYRSQSFLTVPMRNHQDEVIGVLQLLNARDSSGGVPRPFTNEEEALVSSLASQAAIAMTNRALIEEQRALFEAFIQLMAAAIDDKSPYTGGHCRRVPELTMMLADAAVCSPLGSLSGFTMSDADRYELHIAGWLHDCGKVTTPEYVVDKSTKLETIFDRIELVDLRFDVLRQSAQIKYLEACDGADEATRTAHKATYRDTVATLGEEQEFVRRFNVGGEFMPDEAQARVRQIGTRAMPLGSATSTLMTDEEVYNLCISRGTLTAEERAIINNHIVATIKMLESLPYPKHLRRVPEFAGGHHERMDGNGYPRGLKRHEMSVQARIMGIADIFEALTAADRPYKKAMKLSQALNILGRMKLDNHVDPDLFDVFIREKIYLRYAEEFLGPDQMDTVDPATIPGFEP